MPVPPPADVEALGSGVVLVHGGPTQQFFDRMEPHAQYLESRGHLALCPNIRGSSGYGKAFEQMNDRDFGGDDLGDVIAGARVLEDVYRRCSPIYAVHQATTPCFVIQGVGGYPDSAAGRQFALAFEHNYKPFRHATCPGENYYYVFGQANVAAVLADADDFIRFHLGLAGAPTTMPSGAATRPTSPTAGGRHGRDSDRS